MEIRSVRKDAVGHPTVQGSVKSKYGIQTSKHIVQPSMRKGGFTLMTASSKGGRAFKEVNLSELIEKNRAMVERVLQRLKNELEAAEMEHRKLFRDEKLASIFSATMDYQFEKVYEGVLQPGTFSGDFGKLSLNVVVENVRDFRAALIKRNILNPSSDLDYFIEEVEYPLGELEAYFSGAGSLKDSRAASIFTHFIQDKMRGLIRIAQEIDEEYGEELGAGS